MPAALNTLLLDGNGKAATQQLTDLVAEVQQQEPQNAGLMLQLVSNCACYRSYFCTNSVAGSGSCIVLLLA